MIRNPPSMTRSSAASRIFPGSTEGKVHVVDMKTPLDLRLWDWLRVQIWKPRKLCRFLYWSVSHLAKWYEMGHNFLAVWTSGNVPPDEYEERQEICGACEEQITVLDHWAGRFGRWRTGVFCRACGCPRWPPARLGTCLRKERYRCARRKHPGYYPKRGCVGCGGTDNGVNRNRMARQ